MTCFVAKVSSYIIPDSLPVLRNPPRPKHLMQDDYLQTFDFKTLFCDVFYGGTQQANKVVWMGPPLLNLRRFVRSGVFLLNGKTISANGGFKDLHKLNRTLLGEENAQDQQLEQNASLQFKIKNIDGHRLHGCVEVQQNHADVFKGRRVLLLISKNNPFIWIKDLIEFFVKVHGIDAVLCYDNASTAYSNEELLQAIAGVDGVKAAVVVPWNFPWGAMGGPAKVWDSDFTQYVAIEHARFRFLGECAGVISTDIDELLVPAVAMNAFDLLALSPSGAIVYNSRDMMMIDVNLPAQEQVGVLTQAPSLLRFKHFSYCSQIPTNYITRWAAHPAKIPEPAQMLVHNFGQYPMLDVSAQLQIRHFRPMTVLPEKDIRQVPVQFDSALHQKDVQWLELIEKIGWHACERAKAVEP